MYGIFLKMPNRKIFFVRLLNIGIFATGWTLSYPCSRLGKAFAKPLLPWFRSSAG